MVGNLLNFRILRTAVSLMSGEFVECQSFMFVIL